MLVALTAARHPRSLLALLCVPLAASCFNPTVGELTATESTTDPTVGTTGDPPTESTGGSTEPPDADATAATSNDATTEATSGGPAVCGNGSVEGDEECDDGPANGDTAACKADCTLPFCGDGSVWEGMEECDDADDDASDECPGTCMNATCGDGSVWEGTEECDAAGESEACDVDCTLPACGDGVTNLLAGEECDDADGDDSDECPGTCLNATCGDGYLYPAEEQCDTDDLGAASCSDFGLSGNLACNAQCAFDTNDCVAGCPDGGAFISGYCWYLGAGCNQPNVTCASHGLVGAAGYVNAVWDVATMQTLADHYGWINGGDIACCVEFGWVQNATLYTHNFGPQFYNWDGCYDVYSTITACNPP